MPWIEPTEEQMLLACHAYQEALHEDMHNDRPVDWSDTKWNQHVQDQMEFTRRLMRPVVGAIINQRKTTE